MSLTEISFTAPEYQADQSLRRTAYRFRGDAKSGWHIERDGRSWLELGAGYVPVKTLYCGICSTDLARHRLSFPLPQISGHEVVGEYRQRPVAVEINASHLARGLDAGDCLYCREQLDSHCAERLTLGIDRLPGGFAPWILAPVQAIHPLPADMSPQAGVLLEPFAAAVQAVEATPLQEGDRVAVLGPRRLGMLLIAALAGIRNVRGTAFHIVAVMRHSSLAQTARDLGADEVVCLQAGHEAHLSSRFDTVFDTTGNPAGLELALRMAKHRVHLKSTHGRPVMGLSHLTSLVINEQSLSGFTEQNAADLLAAASERSATPRIYVSPTVRLGKLEEYFRAASVEVVSDLDEQAQAGHACDLPFAFGIVSHLDEINQLTRPLTGQGQARLKATGKLLLAPSPSGSWPAGCLAAISENQMELTSSRCGSFRRAIDLLAHNPGLAARMEQSLLTQTLPLDRLAEAMALAARSDKSIKVVVQTR